MLNLLCIPFLLLLTHPQALRLRLQPELLGRNTMCHDSESNPQLSLAFIRLLNNLTDYNAERDNWGFNCNKQSVKGSGSSPQSRAKGSEGRITERGNKKD